MNTIDLDKMKIAWKRERGFEEKRLSEADIKAYLDKKSKDISRLFRVGLTFDIIYKGMIGLSLLGILVLFMGNTSITLMISAILLVMTWAVIFQWRMIRKVPRIGTSDAVIKDSLENKVLFYHRHFVRSLYVGALSNSLFILSGILYYFYFKYGEIRSFRWDDYLVFGAVLMIAYLIGAFAQISQYSFQVKQLEECLHEIDEDTMTAQTIREQKSRKRRMIMIYLLALVCGLLILLFLIFR